MTSMESGGGDPRVDPPPGSPSELPPRELRNVVRLLDTAPSEPVGGERRLGRYLLLDPLGAGGMGLVWKAYDPGLGRIVALKQIREDRVGGKEAIERLHREARLAARLRHPQIVTVHEVGEAEGQHYLVQDYVEGVTLARLLDENRERKRNGEAAGHCRLRQEVRILADVAGAVDFAHRQGVLHRDLKPGNVLIDREERPHVIDFGLATRVVARPDPEIEGWRTLTVEGTILGTPGYMSPEQAAGRAREVGPASDVHALGVILYEILTGRLPFENGTAAEQLVAVLTQDPPRPRRCHPGVPLDLEAVCLQALEREPGRRPATAAEFAAELERWLRGDPVRARRLTLARRLLRFVGRHPRVAAMVAVLALASAWAGISTWRAGVVAREQEILQAKLLEKLRASTATSVKAVRALRRLGGDPAAAEEKFLPRVRAVASEASQRLPLLAEPHYHLGRILRAVGNHGDALAEQTRALALDPQFAPSRFECAVLEALPSLLERLEAARRATRERDLGAPCLALDDPRDAADLGLPAGPLPEERARILADPDVRDLLAELCCQLTRAHALRALTTTAASADDRNRAFRRLGEAVAFGWREDARLSADPDLRSLQDDLRWAELLERMKQ